MIAGHAGSCGGSRPVGVQPVHDALNGPLRNLELRQSPTSWAISSAMTDAAQHRGAPPSAGQYPHQRLGGGQQFGVGVVVPAAVAGGGEVLLEDVNG